MNKRQQLMLAAGLAMALLLTMIPAAAILRAEAPAKPMQSHDFTDVPVSGQEFMEPYINAFYHQGITGGCSVSPMQYCPLNPVTRGSMAVFMGRALGYVDAETAGYDTRAYFKQTTAGAMYHGVIGESVDGRGVWGESTTGTGLYGESDTGIGVEAISQTEYAILAKSLNASGMGVEAGPDSFSDAYYDLELGGSVGEIFASELDFYSNGTIYVELDNNNNEANASFAIYDGANALIMSVIEGGGVFINGNVEILGNYNATGTKSAIVDTVSHGTRTLYAVESTEVWFEDAGSAQLVDGEAIIEFDPIFAETVNFDEDYQVFLTPVGGSALLYVAEKTATHIVIRSDDASDLHFDYRIMAKRLGYEDVRLEEVED